VTFHGVPVHVPKGIPWDIYKQLLRGQYEKAEQQLIAKHLNPQVPVLELGGSIGVVSAYIGFILEPPTPHIIVEANPKLIGNRISDDQQSESVSVQTMNLTRLCEGLERYSLIMDIEGAEFDILRNDAAALSGCELAIIEVHPQHFSDQDGYTVADFVALVQDAGMQHVETIDDVLAFKPASNNAEADTTA